MAAGTGRQTAALLNMQVVRIEAKARRVVRALTWACVALAGVVLLGSALVWTDLTRPDVYGVSPQGVANLLPLIKR